MITLDLPPQKQALLEQVSRQAGMNIEQYINDLIDKYAKPQVQSTPTSYNPQYEEFNFDLERMEQAIDSGFVEMPSNLNSLDDFDKWLADVNRGE